MNLSKSYTLNFSLLSGDEQLKPLFLEISRAPTCTRPSSPELGGISTSRAAGGPSKQGVVSGFHRKENTDSKRFITSYPISSNSQKTQLFPACFLFLPSGYVSP